MHPTQYSPFNNPHRESQHQLQQQTYQKQTTSCKKYPSNKYIGLDDPVDVKHKLFIEEKERSGRGQIRYGFDDKLFQNQRIKQNVGKQNFDRSLLGEERFRSYEGKHFQVSNDHLCSKNLQRFKLKQQLPPKPKSKKQSKHHKNSANKHCKQRAKSCHFSSKPFKKSLIPFSSPQQREQLQMYKKLCITLRKQNEDFSKKISNQQKQQFQFGSEIQQLKQKIKKMYDYCIEKNKSSKNVDYSLKDLIQRHNKGAKNSTSKTFVKGSDKQNFDASQIKNLSRISEVEGGKKSRGSYKTDKASKKGAYNQTIDTTLTTKRDFNTSGLREQKSFRKNISKLHFTQNHSKKQSVSSRFISNESSSNLPRKFPQYDQQSEAEISQIKKPPQSQNEYRQFFTTFVKSLEIFQSSAPNQRKSKSKLLKDGGYYIQWAKQEWLQIVEYLIKKGYVSGRQFTKKTKWTTEGEHKTIR